MLLARGSTEMIGKKGWLWVVALGLMAPLHAAEVTALWDANPPDQEVIEYVVYVDDGEAMRVTDTTATIDIAPGAHVIEVTAVNLWGESGRSNPVATPAIATPPTVQITVTVIVGSQ